MPEVENYDKAVDQNVSATKRSAMALTIVTAIAITALWYFNSSRLLDVHRRRDAEEWYFRARQAMCRYRAYERRDSLFFQALAASVLRNKLKIKRVDVPCYPAERFNYAAELWGAIECFGDKMATTSKDLKSPSLTIDPTQAINVCFTEDSSRAIMNRMDVRENLRTVYVPSSWRNLVLWMVLDWWPPPGGYGLGRESLGPAEYGSQWRESRVWLFERRLLDELSDTDGRNEEVNVILQETSDAAFRFWVQQGSSSPDTRNITIPGYGATLRSDEFLVAMGPLIVLAYLVFYLNWWRLDQTSELGVNALETLRNGFPLFGSPRDPLGGGPAEAGLAERSARFLWFSILAAPIAALSVLVVLRGDLGVFAETSVYGERTLERLLFLRGLGGFSIFIDTVNLCALWLALACMLEIGAPGRQPIGRRLWKRVVVGALTMAFFLEWGIRTYYIRTVQYASWHGINRVKIEWVLILFLCFGLLWCWALARALDRKSAIGKAVAIAGLLLAFGLII